MQGELIMGNSRYEIIKTTEHKKWLPESPIKIEKSQLLFDTLTNQKILQVKMYNLSDKSIRSVYLDLECFDDAMDFISSQSDIPLQELNTKPQSYFGDRLPIILDSLNTSNIRININKVVFSDDTIWRNENREIEIELPPQNPINWSDVFYEQVIRECKGTNVKPLFWYENTKEYWRCSCGQPNTNRKIKCGYCGTSKEWLEQHFNEEYLNNAQAEYFESEKIRQQKELEYSQQLEEEKKRLQIRQQEEIDKQIQLKKRKKKRIVTSIVAVVAAVILGIISYTIIVPPEARAYFNAMSLYKQGNYEESINAFVNLGEYKDSKEMLTKSIIGSNYEYAVSLLEEDEYEKASEIFEKLSGYKDSDEKLKIAKEHIK